MGSEVAGKADFTGIRYAQCWEDADILLEALDIRPDDVCLSIASAGDNALAMLSKGPKQVVALDLSPAQLACLELRVAGYSEFQHSELLELVGSRPSTRRPLLYDRCKKHLSQAARDFWDARQAEIERGIGSLGKFEHYFELFRNRVLPLVHSRKRVDRLLRGGSPAEREAFFQGKWNSWRWRLLFKMFFSRFVMGRLGRDPSFFQYVEGSVSDRILSRTQHALTKLDPADNPYLQWILAGSHTTALPYALRLENFEAIRANLNRLDWRCLSVEDYLANVAPKSISKFNLSDIFEYMSPAAYETLLGKLVESGRVGGRLAYWNMLAPRSRQATMADRLEPKTELAARLHLEDKAFFYSRFVVEEIVA